MVVTGFEQFEVGQVFTSTAELIDAEAIKSFARLFDNQPQHIDEAAAESSMFGTLVASGWHTASLTMRLILKSAFEGVSGRGLGVGIQSINWPAPVYPGDWLHAETEVIELRPSRSKPDRGLVVMRTVTRKQGGVVVQDITHTCLFLRSDA